MPHYIDRDANIVTPLRRRLRFAFALLTAVIAAGAAGCVYLETKEREIVYRPVRDYVRTPADLGLSHEELWLAVPRIDGPGDERIHAWWLPSARAEAPTILYLHGVRWSLGNNLFRIARWQALGFNVLAIDYRGFGRSDGALPSEREIYADARAAWVEVRRREPRTDRRFLYGHSLGAAVALELAATEDGAAGVIAESGFTSLPDMAADRNLPVGALLTQRFDALERVKTLRIPAMFIHGTADAIVPASMSERLYAATPSPKRLLLIEGGSHSNFAGTGMADYRRAVDDFVELAQLSYRARGASISMR
jgi:pimeloyl-ACP methyl ester carboxylesterase